MPRSDMQRLYQNTHKLMQYWFARIMLEMSSNDANAFKSGIHGSEFRAIRRHGRRMRYQKLRENHSSYEVRAILDGTTASIVKHRSNTANRRQAERLGGYPKAGTQAYTRWLVAR